MREMSTSVCVALAFGLLATLTVSSAHAQQSSIRGLVSSTDDGGVLVGAHVILSRPSGKRVGAAVTNVDGLYQIRHLEPGTYRIRVSHIGYQTHQDTLRLSAGRRTVDVALPLGQRQLDEVRVEAERGATERHAGAQTVGPADLGRIPTPGPSGDLAAYLQTLPGVVSLGDRGGGMYIRGGTPSQNLTLVDGLRIIKPFHLSSLYSAFPENLVRTVDVHAGGFGAEYMGAISSVLDVSLRNGNLKHNEASASVSPFVSSAHFEGPLNEGTTSILAHARYSLIEHAASGVYGQEAPFRFYDVTARYSAQLASGTSCNFTGIRTHDRGQLNADRPLELSWTNAVIGGRCLFYGEGLGHPIDLTVGHTYFENEAGTPDAPQRSASLRKTYIDVSATQDLFGSALDYGARWVVTNYTFDLDEQFILPKQSNKFTAALQAHASMEFRPTNQLRVTPSLGTHVTARRVRSPTVEPRIRLSVRPGGTDEQEISMAAGIYNQVANGISDERDAGTVFTTWTPREAGDPLARAVHGILGYRQQIGSSVNVSVEGYAKELSNIPVPEWSAVAQFDTETTLADGRAYGFDVRTEVEWGAFYGFVGYGWSSIQYEASRQRLGAWIGGNVVEYRPAHDRRHQLQVVSSFELGDFTVNASWKGASGRPYTKVSQFDYILDLEDESPTRTPGTPYVFYDRPFNARLPTYHRLDVSVERTVRLSDRVSVNSKAGVINSYDRSNIFYYDVHTLQRVDQSPILPYVSLTVSIQ